MQDLQKKVRQVLANAQCTILPFYHFVLGRGGIQKYFTLNAQINYRCSGALPSETLPCLNQRIRKANPF